MPLARVGCLTYRLALERVGGTTTRLVLVGVGSGKVAQGRG